MARRWIGGAAVFVQACFYSPTGSEAGHTATTETSMPGPTTGVSAPTSTEADPSATTGASATDSADSGSVAADVVTESSDSGGSELCGNGLPDPGEECDAGPGIPGESACTPMCTTNVCGDGYVWTKVEKCDPGAGSGECDADCTPVMCGDGVVNPFAGETCDDGNQIDGDGCQANCKSSVVTGLYANGERTCVTLTGGVLKCWGSNAFGALGVGNLDDIGAAQTASAAGIVDFGLPILRVGMGVDHTCVIVKGGLVRCWGSGEDGRLGYANTGGGKCLEGMGHSCAANPVCCVGDNEPANTVGAVDVGGVAVDVVAGVAHTCALIDDGRVRCWGSGQVGAAGLGSKDVFGDDEAPASTDAVSLGTTAKQLYATQNHSCAVLDMLGVRCWGLNAEGQLGIGSSATIGDDELPSAAPQVALGGIVATMGLGAETTCAARKDGKATCWGFGGTLGNGSLSSLNVPSASMDVGGDVLELAGNGTHTCARLTDGTVRCWGFAGAGVLGYGDTESIGDQPGEMPPPALALDGVAVMLAAGEVHTCALLEGNRVKCWGANARGQLGYGHTDTVGNEPGEMPPPDVPIFE